MRTMIVVAVNLIMNLILSVYQQPDRAVQSIGNAMMARCNGYDCCDCWCLALMANDAIRD